VPSESTSTSINMFLYKDIDIRVCVFARALVCVCVSVMYMCVYVGYPGAGKELHIVPLVLPCGAVCCNVLQSVAGFYTVPSMRTRQQKR